MEFMVSVFTVGSVFGYIAEMLWCYGMYHVFESRQGMVFGPFSQIYGLGAVLLTLLINRESSALKIFLVSGVVGGIYEYFCSYIQEKLFGTISWDYGDGVLSIGGRTHVAFCVFWGLMGVFLIRFVNPSIITALSKLNGSGKTVISAVVTVFFILNLQLSYMAVKRQTGRRMNIPPATAIDEWLDVRYNDQVLEKIYPNMRVISSDK